MRRFLFVSLGLLELAVAAVLLVLSFQLPTSDNVRHSMTEVQKVAQQTSQQIGLAKAEIESLRHPELQQAIKKLQKELPQITAMLRGQNLNYDSLRQTKDLLADVSRGIRSFSKVLSPDDAKKLSQGLKATADYFENEVAPAAATAAARVEKTTGLLATDAEALSELLKEQTPDLQAAQDIHDSLGRLSEGLGQVKKLIDPKQLTTMREGFEGIETSLSLGSQQVGQLASYSYPVVSFKGFRPEINQRPFWPQGKEIAAGMAKGARGVSAAGKQLDQLTKELPGLTKSIEESQLAAKKTQEMLAHALKNRKQLEKVLKEIPGTSVRLAKEVPALGKDLARILRETEKLKIIAGSLREAQKRVDQAILSWPLLKLALASSADVVDNTRKQMEVVLANENNHKRAFQQTLELTEALGRMMPSISEQFDNRMTQRAASLGQLEQSIQKAEKQVPVLAQGASDILKTVRWLLWLFAGLVTLHAIYTFALTRPAPAPQ